mgnify:CR=1 FL=1
MLRNEARLKMASASLQAIDVSRDGQDDQQNIARLSIVPVSS